ncbi:hypothetical protein SmphiM12_485 [Sinorhizobium phage phiM12]|uniref:Uncharacterized protein n=1 Tax=Sinorhizobium phage phiM12 TaxID=1357423 RepID=S5MW12_9CAUD|nr:hypothetical protein AB690_gp140 [Sinorhizobium phage phiM12]AGR48117.2 hypothetical protein SmphiM12_485 [Sinorhizobium phage phiM12]
MKKTLFYLSGLPALGKSTFVNRLLKDHTYPIHVMSVDGEIDAIAAARGVTYDSIFAEVREEAREIAKAKLQQAIDDGRISFGIR